MNNIRNSLRTLRETVANWLKTVIGRDDESQVYHQRDGYYT